jgi:hypothetical protein
MSGSRSTAASFIAVLAECRHRRAVDAQQQRPGTEQAERAAPCRHRRAGLSTGGIETVVHDGSPDDATPRSPDIDVTGQHIERYRDNDSRESGIRAHRKCDGNGETAVIISAPAT